MGLFTKKSEYIIDWNKVKTVKDLKAIVYLGMFAGYGLRPKIVIRNAGKGWDEAVNNIRKFCVDD